MSFICSVIGLPDRVVFAFVIITAASTYIAAGFIRLVLQRCVAVAEIFSRMNQEKSTALLALIGNIILLYPVKKVIVEKGYYTNIRLNSR